MWGLPRGDTQMSYLVCHLLDFPEQNEDNTGRRTNNPDGLPPILTNWCPYLCHPHHFYTGCLPGTTLPIYPGLGQAPNMLYCIPGGFVKEMLINKW